jgi:hypothetical protein
LLIVAFSTGGGYFVAAITKAGLRAANRSRSS